jgi:signal transduction histidine kinase
MGDATDGINYGLSRRWHKILRPLWLIVAVGSISLFVAGIPGRYEQLLSSAVANESILADLGLSATFYAAYFIALDLVLVMAHFVIAAILYRQAPENTMATLVALVLITTPLAVIGALTMSAPSWRFVANVIVYLGLATSIVLLYLFPDGRFVPRWTRPMAILWAGFNLLTVFFPTSPFSLSTWPAFIQALLLLTFSGSGLYAQIYRYRNVSRPIERRQSKWAILGLAAAAFAPLGHYLNLLNLPSASQAAPPDLFFNLADPALFMFATTAQLVGLTLYTLFLLVFPLSFAIAILRYQLFDVEIVINRTLVYGSLTALIIALYVLIVGALGSIFQARGSPVWAVIATGFIAFLFAPLRTYLQRLVNRLMYGDRDDPVAVLNQLGKRLEETPSPDSTLPIIVESIINSLKLPYAGIALKDGEQYSLAVEAGVKQGEPIALPLIYQSETIGVLSVSPRKAGENLSPSERKLLRNIARQAGPAVHAVQLNADLVRSRERLVTAREEERRRLRRDLHDGLGPRLATLTLKLDAARNLLKNDLAAADQLLIEVKDQAQATIVDIRHLVNDLRPPALDQLGLISALEEYAAAQSKAESLSFMVQADEDLPPLRAAVEVAVYRITMEAMTNVVKHASASSCMVRLSFELETNELTLNVCDNGQGLPDKFKVGVGLASMHERAAELGGMCQLTAAPGGGTCVNATFPVSHES